MRKLLMVVAVGMLACESREDVQMEAREDVLEEMEEEVEDTERLEPCDLTGEWDVEETLSGGTCEEEERLSAHPLRISLEDRNAALAISVTRGETVFEECSGTRPLEGCAVDITCSPAEAQDLDVSLELELASDGRLSGREILTYRDGVDFCNVELRLQGTPAAAEAPQ